LSEGASIPCPRCGGHGHIRDTESSALQILRIIQEESMKDGTAAVHVQVPVEVASFLLNEKRTEIAKIELKQRLNVIMVPNKTLETPNYRLERLKHDDPRLDNLQASYHMAEEIEDPTTVTRRTHERSNKQEPVIKGVLPDAPAPIAEIKPVPAKAEPAAAKPAPRAPARAPAPVPAPAERGFMAWIKSFFGVAPAPVAVPAPAVEARKEEKREVRADGRGEGRGDGRRGGRGRDGERRDGRRGEGRGRDGEQRREREARAEAGEGQPRTAEGGRGRDGEQRGSDAGRQRDGEQRRGERQERGEVRGEREVREGRVEREPREGRGEGRGERQGQRERREGESRGVAEGAAANLQAGAELSGTEQRQDRPPRGERGERGEGRRERGDGRRGERRGERGPREPATAAEAAEVEALAGAATSVGVVADMGDQTAPAADAVLESHTHQDARPVEAQDGEERRDRRSRDRYGRDRRERGDRQPRDEGAAAPVVATEGEAAPERSERTRYPTGFASEEAESAAVPAAATQPDRPAMAPAPAAPGLPKVQPFQLPVDDLIQVAQGSGLQWVNSDAEKIAAVQAAIAAEPQPVHVPRERPPAIVIDEAPLVMVETKRDLRELKLPFEQASLPLQ
jgi:ribonuclease E